MKTFTGCLLLFTATLSPAAEIRDELGLVAKGAELEEIWNEGEFTEGVAAAPDGTIYFSDIAFDPKDNGRILKLDETGKVTVHAAKSYKSNGLYFDQNGKLLAACGANIGARAICEVTADGRVKPIVDRYMGKHFNAPNDLVVLPDGTLYFSDPRYVGPEKIELDHMSVYRVSPDRKTVARVTTDIQKPNGVHASPDGKTLYVAETNNGSTDVTKMDPNTKLGRMTLNAFPIEPDGSLGKKTMLVDFGDKTGTDGMTLDKTGRIYAAVRADDRPGIRIYTPKGREVGYIPTETLPTNCCFGRGKDAATLYVTSGTGLYRIKMNPKKVTGLHHN